MQASIQISDRPELQYLLRIGDTALIQAQRLGEWTGHAPVLEEDIALANMALDLLGQCRAVLTHAGALEGAGRDEDQLAFLRDERDYRNVTLVELPRGDFAFSVLRNAFAATWFKLLWEKLADSKDAELFAADAVDEHAAATRLGPRWSELREPWMAEMAQILGEAGLAQPAALPFLSTGKRGVHSEHMGFVLAEMQQLQRAFPGGAW